MESLVDRIDGITFRKGKKEIGPSQVFDEYYDGLEALLRHNREENRGHQPLRDRVEKEDQERELELFKEWRDSIPSDISVETTYDDTKRNLAIRPRYNIETTFSGEAELRGKRQREPNVLFLEEKDGSQAYVLRRAMTYTPDSHTFQTFNKKIGNKHDHFAYDDFLPDDVEGYQHGKKGGQLFIPEPFLLAGLERAYESLDVARFTPKHSHVQTDESTHTSYILRPYLDSVRSRPTDEGKFPGYLASLHNLGIMDKYDRQAEDYCIGRGGHWSQWGDIVNIEKAGVKPTGAPVVNIDPDYVVHVGSVKQELHHDRADFFDRLTTFQQNILEDDSEWFLNTYRAMRNGDEYHDVFRQDLLPRSIDKVEETYGEQLVR